MTRLPRISARECIAALERGGFRFSRQKGSHYIMLRADPPARVVIPLHDEIGPGLLRSALRDAGLSVDEFIVLLKGK